MYYWTCQGMGEEDKESSSSWDDDKHKNVKDDLTYSATLTWMAFVILIHILPDQENTLWDNLNLTILLKEIHHMTLT